MAWCASTTSCALSFPEVRRGVGLGRPPLQKARFTMEKLSPKRIVSTEPHPFMSHVLIVEDDANAREALAAFAAGEGYTVAQAASVREARIQLVRQQPDVMLVDLRLPDGAGTEIFADLDDRTAT